MRYGEERVLASRDINQYARIRSDVDGLAGWLLGQGAGGKGSTVAYMLGGRLSETEVCSDSGGWRVSDSVRLL